MEIEYVKPKRESLPDIPLLFMAYLSGILTALLNRSFFHETAVCLFELIPLRWLTIAPMLLVVVFSGTVFGCLLIPVTGCASGFLLTLYAFCFWENAALQDTRFFLLWLAFSVPAYFAVSVLSTRSSLRLCRLLRRSSHAAWREFESFLLPELAILTVFMLAAHFLRS